MAEHRGAVICRVRAEEELGCASDQLVDADLAVVVGVKAIEAGERDLGGDTARGQERGVLGRFDVPVAVRVQRFGLGGDEPADLLVFTGPLGGVLGRPGW